MENEVTNYPELLSRIEYLKIEKIRQEEELRHLFSEFVNTLNPITIVKESLHKLVEDKQVKVDFVKAGLNIGATFLIDLVFGRQRSVKDFLSSTVASKISTALINTNFSKIISGVTKLLPQKLEQKNS